jgi:hypothetical protein
VPAGDVAEVALGQVLVLRVGPPGVVVLPRLVHECHVRLAPRLVPLSHRRSVLDAPVVARPRAGVVRKKEEREAENAKNRQRYVLRRQRRLR